MTLRTVLAAALSLGLTASAAFAQAPTPAGPGQHKGINAREARQHARIKDGVRDGSLTRPEATRLAREQRAIRAEERAFRRSGQGLTRFERRDLQQDLNRTNRQIRCLKHNGRG